MTGRIRKSFRNGKDNIASFQTNLNERTRRAARKTDYYVHDHAWTMIAVSAGLAFAAGLLLSRGNQHGVAKTEREEISNPPEKVRKINSWKFVRSYIPLVFLLWKAFPAPRGSRKAQV